MKKQLFGIYLIVFFLLCSGFVISSPSGIKNIPNHNLADQGDSVGRSVKNIIDATDPNRRITITLAHVSGYLDEDTTYVFSTNETIPNNVTLEIEPGAIISGNATLTINGPFEAGLTKCFDSSVTISFGDGSIEKAYPQWWDAKVDGSTDDTTAVESAIDAYSKTFFTAGTWRFNITIDSSGHILEGAGKKDTIFRPYSDAPVIEIDSDGSTVQNTVLRDFYIYGDTTKSSQDGILIDGTNGHYYLNIENVNIYYCGRDGLSIKKTCSLSDFQDMSFAYNERYGIYIDSDSTGTPNILDFINVRSVYNKNHGWRLVGDSTYQPNYITFLNCTSTNNGTGTNTTHGFYVTNCRGLIWHNVRCEANGTGADGYGNDSCGILFDGIYHERHVISGGTIINHHYGINISAGSNNALIEIGGGVSIYHTGTITNPQSGVKNGSSASTEVLYGSVKNTYVMPIDDAVDVNGNYHIHMQVPESPAYRTFTGSDTTPSVKQSNVFKTANGSSTTITDFDDGYRGQIIKVIIKDGNTIIDFTSSGLKGNRNIDWYPAINDWMECVYDGTDWFCSVSNDTIQNVYPQQFGAIGNGTTDDTTAIQNALNSGKNIFFPTGTYLISDELDLTTNGQTIEGSGYYAVLQLDDGSDCSMMNLQSGKVRVTIKNMRLDGDGSNQSATSNGIIFSGLNDYCKIDNVFLEDIRDIGVNFTSTSSVCKANYVNVHVNTGDIGVYLGYGRSNEIIYGSFRNLTGFGIEIAKGWSTVVHGNHFENNDAVKTLDTAGIGIVISDNHISNWDNNGIYLSKCRGTRIENNTFTYSGTVPQTCIHIDPNDVSSGAVIGVQSTYNITGSTFLAFDRGLHIDCTNSPLSFRYPNLNTIYHTYYADISTSGTGEDDLLSTTVYGEAIAKTGGIRVVSGGTKSGTNNTKTIKLYYGATSFTVFSDANDVSDWHLDSWFINENSSSSQRVYWKFISGSTVTSDWTTASIATGSDFTVKLTGECLDAGDSITQKIFGVYFIEDNP